MKIILLISLLFFSGLFLNAQNIDFRARHFRDDPDGFRKANAHLREGRDYMREAENALEEKKENNSIFLFEKAIENFLKAHNFNPDNSALNFKIGRCYLGTFHKTKAVSFLERAIELDTEGVNVDVYYLLGLAYRYNYEFDKAIEQFRNYQAALGRRDLQEVRRTLRSEIADTEFAKTQYNNPQRVFVRNMEELNSPYADYNAAITADQQFMVFNSRRPAKNLKDDDGRYFTNIYISYFENGQWTPPQDMGAPLNTDGHDECLALSPDGHKMYLRKIDDASSNIYLSKLSGDQWQEPVKMPTAINNQFNQTHASFSHDGIKLYYISDQMGAKDIFFSGIMDISRDQWGRGQRIGYGLSTTADEGSIYFHPDGRTIYFSSRGHNSMGGYDIFKTVQGRDGIWSRPENLGYPINTPFDEKYFTVSADGRHAYVTSNREGGQGEWDIYRVRFLGPVKHNIVDNEDQLLASIAEPIREVRPEPPVEIETTNLTVLRGHVIDDFTKEPVEARIEIVNNTTNQVVSVFHSNSKTGRFLVSLPSGINYGIAVESDGYLFHSENFDLPELSDYQLVDRDIYLKNVAIGSKIVLRNIFFDTGQSRLRAESTTELNRLYELLKDIPSLRIEISGHTDNIGTEAYNIKLSEERALAVVNFLVQKGIDRNRLVYKGYGPNRPIATNDTPEGRQLNRRTEFEILGN